VIFEMEEMNQQQADNEMPIYVCPYCGKEAPQGLDHPNLFACCGELGHAEEA
jgi:hypothetical protein